MAFMVVKDVRYRRVMLLLVAAVACYALSGVYIVRASERAVVLVFGKLVTLQPIGPGVHWCLPFPFGRVIKKDILKRKRMSVGIEAVEDVTGRSGMMKSSQFLTGDANIVNVGAVVQFKVADIVAYALRCIYAEGLIKAFAEAALTKIVASKPIDSVLTYGRFATQGEVKELLQRWLNECNVGVSIVSVNFSIVTPPPEVTDAFHEVTRAREERQKLINEAYSYRSERLPEVRGMAEKIVSEAQAFKVRLINQAIGDARKFVAMAKEYRRSPSETKVRLYIEAMEQILPRMKKYVLDSQSERRVNLTLLEQLETAKPDTGESQR
ncbi:MAG: hypothetical protein GDYSWBUE_001731 [Candidatus Fervidibacterota bacterium]